jgi:hypothetical protein
MLRLAPRNLLLHFGLFAVCVPATATAQIFARAALDAEETSNASCGLLSCPPRALTYGYYHEHWRRWPEEPGQAELTEALSPFTRRDGGLPAVQVPPASEEDSMVPRLKKSTGTATSEPAPGGGTSQPSPGAGATNEPPSTVIQPQADNSDLPADLPGSPGPQPTESSGGFFPPTDVPQLPAGGAEPGTESTLPPAESNQLPPADPFNDEPADSGTQEEDVFDLDDFGRSDSQRLRRYRMSSTTQLRPHGAARSRIARRTASPQIQLAAYRPASVQRRNPLRSSLPPECLQEPTAVARPSEWATEPIELQSMDGAERALEWAESTEPVGDIRRRSNPLR